MNAQPQSRVDGLPDLALKLLLEIEALYEDQVDGLLRNGERYDPFWWRGTCDSVCSTVLELGWLDEAEVVFWGTYTPYNKNGEQEPVFPSGHCWIELGDLIVDPTRWQFDPSPGFHLPRIVAASGDRYGEYEKRISY